MPKPTKKQLAPEERCRTCDAPLGRLRSETVLGHNECCCRRGYCLSCSHEDKED